MSGSDACALERDLYRTVLGILRAPDPAEPLRQVLGQLVDRAGAHRGYLELYGDASLEQRRWTISHHCSESDEEEIRAVTSRGIVTSAIASGTTLHTPYALLDERFSTSRSVREQRLEAVLCVPLKGRCPGVLYLEGKHGQGPFPPDVVRLAEEIADALASATDRAVGDRPGGSGDPTAPFRAKLQLDGLVGRSPALARVFEQVALAAPLDVTVLLTGASGTGKTQLAQALHANSPRRGGPFVELNCAAIPEGLIESELFGTRPSAFPGARHTTGKVEAAEGGTLLLDEISEIPFPAQAKLLQLLHSKQFYPLASPRPVTANVRLIAATNTDLSQQVADKRFREDLYYRINVFNIRMPSLSERRGDLPLLVEALVARLASEHGLPALRASSGFLAVCEAADWPGNVRQLRHKVEGALIRACAQGASILEPAHLDDSNAAVPPDGPVTFHEATRLFQRDLLRRELEAAAWNVSEVARRLDLTRSHVYNLIKAFALVRTQGP